MADTNVDKLLAKIKNNRILSVLIVIGISIGTVLTLTGQILDLFSKVSSASLFGKGKDETPGIFRTGPFILRFSTPARKLNLNGFEATWSKDGKLLAYLQRNYAGENRLGTDLMLSSDGGRTARRIASVDKYVIQPSFSPNGRWIAFVECAAPSTYGATDRTWPGEGCGIATVDIGSGAMEVVYGTDGSNAWLIYDDQELASYDWSPDSTQLTYASGTFDGYRIGYNLTLFQMNGHTTKTLIEKSAPPSADDSYIVFKSPRWSPDGKQIAFLTGVQRAGEFHAFLVDANGGSARPLSSIDADNEITWLDNRTIVFASLGASTHAIRSCDTLTGQVTQYTARSEFFSAQTVPGSNYIIFKDLSAEGMAQPETKWVRLGAVGGDPAPILTIGTVGNKQIALFAQDFSDATVSEGVSVPNVPAHLRTDGQGRRFAIAVNGSLYVGELN